MKVYHELKGSVRELRKQELTYKEIQERLSVRISKSTLSYWCTGLVLPDWYQAKVNDLNFRNFSKARQLAVASNKIKHERLLADISEKNGLLGVKLKDMDTLKMLLAVLYLGEGAKWKSHSGLVLGSSDPDIILIYLRLLKACYRIEPENLKGRISYRADQDIDSLEDYWSKITLIPRENFYKTKPDPRTLNKPTRKIDYKGVCVIMGGSSSIQLELEAIPSIILKSLNEEK